MALRLERYGAELSQRERLLLSGVRSLIPSFAPPDDADLLEHGATLDWLAARVTTAYLLTLDSDVEFLAAGWLSRMLALMERRQLAALGAYEPEIGAYRARLAPCVLLLRRDTLQRLGATFRGFARFGDRREAERWRARPAGLGLDAAELAAYPSATIYPTAAWLFECLQARGERWQQLPDDIARMWLHLGQMSWPQKTQRRADRAILAARPDRDAYVRDRLRLYEPWPAAVR